MQLSPITFLIFALALVASHLLARALTGWSRGVALRRGIVSQVTGRSSHSVPTPRLGGLGLGLGYGLAAALFFGALWLAPRDIGWIAFMPSVVGWMALGWAIMVATGLLDDVFDLQPAVKLVLMAVATVPPVVGADLAVPLPNLWLLPTWAVHGLGWLVAIVWILYFTNGFNFMDGMDGFAASFFYCAALTMFACAIVAGVYSEAFAPLVNAAIPLPKAQAGLLSELVLLPVLLLGIWGLLTWNMLLANGQHAAHPRDWFWARLAMLGSLAFVAVLVVAARMHHERIRVIGAVRGEACLLPIVAMACSGFLRWNRPPARVFMGDGGSLGLGYLLAVAALAGANRVLGHPLPLRTSLTVLMPFVFDVTLTLARRARRREKLWRAHREHLYQRLLRAGFTHGEALWINARRFTLCAAAAFLGVTLGGGWLWVGLALALAVMIDYWQRVVALEERLAAAGAGGAKNAPPGGCAGDEKKSKVGPISPLH